MESRDGMLWFDGENAQCGVIGLNPWSQLVLCGEVMELLGCADFARRN